eukprot:scaffold3808_cov112-Isochrysis_galbana.AAC.27
MIANVIRTAHPSCPAAAAYLAVVCSAPVWRAAAATSLACSVPPSRCGLDAAACRGSGVMCVYKYAGGQLPPSLACSSANIPVLLLTTWNNLYTQTSLVGSHNDGRSLKLKKRGPPLSLRPRGYKQGAGERIDRG